MHPSDEVRADWFWRIWNAVMYRRPSTEGQWAGREELTPRLPLRIWRALKPKPEATR